MCKQSSHEILVPKSLKRISIIFNPEVKLTHTQLSLVTYLVNLLLFCSRQWLALVGDHFSGTYCARKALFEGDIIHVIE